MWPGDVLVGHYNWSKLQVTQRISLLPWGLRSGWALRIHVWVYSLKCTYSFLADTWRRVPLHNAKEHLNPWCIWAIRHRVSGGCSLEPAYKEHGVHDWGLLCWLFGFFFKSRMRKCLTLFTSLTDCEAFSHVWRHIWHILEFLPFLAWIIHTFRNALERPKPSVSLLLPKMLAKSFGARHHPECMF